MASETVLALDIAPGTTGFAFGSLSGKLPTRHGFWRMPEAGGEGAIYAAFANVLWNTLDELKPSKLIIESPLPPQAQTDTNTAFKIYAMRGYCLEACHRHSIAFSGVGISDWRMELFGCCRWPGGSEEGKREAVKYVRKLGLDVSVHDEAEAVMVWLYYRAEMSRAWSNSSLRDAAD